MKSLNIPSYSHLIPREHRIRSIQELYDYIYRWKQEVEATIQKKEPAFSGTYTSTADLDAVTTANDNDYAWVTRVDSDNNTVYDHYRYVAGSGWVYEYTASNPTFSTAEWASIQSTITLELVNKLSALPTNSELTTLLNGKADDATTIEGYGITDAKIENGVITLGNNTITPLTAHQDISGKANASDLATVATSGDYNDLSNKPTIPTVPTDVSAFNNDAGYLTSHQDLSSYALKSEVPSIWTGTQAEYDALSTVSESTIYIIKES